MSDTSSNGGNLLNLQSTSQPGLKSKYATQTKEYQERVKKLGLDQKKAKYDEMDYGDECNDQEERRYAKEEAGDQESSEAEEEGEESQEESQEKPKVEQLATNFSKR